jgi:hypothetical protein
MWDEKGKETVEKELLGEGVAVMGRVTEEWMRALEDYCATVPYDTVLSLGCERREDSYKVVTVSHHFQRTALHCTAPPLTPVGT